MKQVTEQVWTRTSHPNLRKTPSGGRMMARRMSTQLAVPSSAITSTLSLSRRAKKKVDAAEEEATVTIYRPKLHVQVTCTGVRFASPCWVCFAVWVPLFYVGRIATYFTSQSGRKCHFVGITFPGIVILWTPVVHLHSESTQWGKEALTQWTHETKASF
ncbi:hypothetical protein BHM03_00028687 [Ensete ventricosum]|nr:hypothetical protein BHM03_00028687 [Ensete ventricosum]